MKVLEIYNFMSSMLNKTDFKVGEIYYLSDERFKDEEWEILFLSPIKFRYIRYYSDWNKKIINFRIQIEESVDEIQGNHFRHGNHFRIYKKPRFI